MTSESSILAIQISTVICILLAYITQAVRVYFDKNVTKNKLSLWPYYIIICYLLTQGINYGVHFKNAQKTELLTVYWTLGNINCFFWCEIIIVQCYEWNLINSLVDFQSSLDLSVMGVKVDTYRQVEEPKQTRAFWLRTSFNLIFHAIKIILIAIWVHNDKTLLTKK